MYRRFRLSALCILGTMGYCAHARAQATRYDSTRRHLRPEISNSTFALRAGLGVQGSFFYEIGLARTRFEGAHHGIGGFSYYAVFVGFPAFRKDEVSVAGGRVGIDYCANGLMLGVGGGSNWAGDKRDLFFAPKAGLGFPDCNVCYTYNFSAFDFTIGRVGHHAVSIQASPALWHHNKLTGMTRWFWQPKKPK